MGDFFSASEIQNLCIITEQFNISSFSIDIKNNYGFDDKCLRS